jgi:DNA gyrase subunit A
MQLRRLAALERDKIEKEYEEIKKLIDELTFILKNPQKVIEIVIDELNTLKDKFGDDRLTRIYKQKLGEFSEEDLVPKEETLITITKTGYIKRVSIGTYKIQRRGGKGVMGMTTKEEDEIDHLISATTHDTIMFFTDKGKVYGTKVWELPDSSRQSKGQAVVNILNVDQGERIMSVLPLHEECKNIIMATAKGNVKKTSIDEFKNMRASGIIAIRLDADDSLVSVRETSGNDHVMILTKQGKSIRFPEENARTMGRATSGVRGISISKDDEVISMEVFLAKQIIPEDKRKKVFRDVLTISEKGLGKRTPVMFFPIQKRSGKGVKASVVNSKTGPLAAACLVTNEIDQVVVTSKFGQVIKLPLKNIPEMGRSTQGVILMRFANSNDCVAAIATLDKSGGDEEE